MIDAGTHRARDGDVANVDALCRSRLGANDLIHERGEVRLQRFRRKRDFADRCVDVAALVDAELDLSCLHLADGAGDVERHCAGLRVGHETARTENAAECAELAHLVGCCDENVEIEPVFLDLRDVLGADDNRRRPASASRAFSPSAMTRTRTVLPVPAGSTTVPRTT